MKTIRIGILGEFRSAFRPHIVVKTMLNQVADRRGVNVEQEWISTLKLVNPDTAGAVLTGYHGIWCSPGSPYKNTAGALNGIRYARENKVPFIGTCGGFQHMILEYAQNVLGYVQATYGDQEKEGEIFFITPLPCALTGQTLNIQIAKASLAYQAWKRASITEHYYCRFGINPKYLPVLLKSNPIISGMDKAGEPRILELANHPFYLGTLFVPGDALMFGNTGVGGGWVHPLIDHFILTALNTTAHHEIIQA